MSKSKEVHKYRQFKVERHMLQRAGQKERRARMKDIALRNGLDFSGMPLESLDSFILETFGRPLSIIGYD